MAKKKIQANPMIPKGKWAYAANGLNYNPTNTQAMGDWHQGMDEWLKKANLQSTPASARPDDIPTGTPGHETMQDKFNNMPGGIQAGFNAFRGVGQMVSNAIPAGLQAAAALIPEQQDTKFMRPYLGQTYNPYQYGSGSSNLFENGGYMKYPNGGSFKKNPRFRADDTDMTMYPTDSTLNPPAPQPYQLNPLPPLNVPHPNREVIYEPMYDVNRQIDSYVPRFGGDWNQRDVFNFSQNLPSTMGGYPVLRGESYMEENMGSSNPYYRPYSRFENGGRMTMPYTAKDGAYMPYAPTFPSLPQNNTMPVYEQGGYMAEDGCLIPYLYLNGESGELPSSNNKVIHYDMGGYLHPYLYLNGESGELPTEGQFAASGIHIKPENRGKFTATKKKTGKSTEELTHSKNPLTRKRAVFAQNARKWHHGDDGLAMGPSPNEADYYSPSYTDMGPAPGGEMQIPQQGLPINYMPPAPTGESNIIDIGASRSRDYSDQTFSKAFNAARKELGAGKTFHWKGKEYSTRLANENKSPSGTPISRAKQVAPENRTFYNRQANEKWDAMKRNAPHEIVNGQTHYMRDAPPYHYYPGQPFFGEGEGSPAAMSKRAKGEQPGVDLAKTLLGLLMAGTSTRSYQQIPGTPQGRLPSGPSDAMPQLPPGSPRALPSGGYRALPSPTGTPFPQVPIPPRSFAYGGNMNVGDELDLTPEQIQYYRSLGYDFSE